MKIKREIVTLMETLRDAILIVATALLIFMIIFYIIIIKHDNYDIVKDLLYLTDKKDAISYMVTMYSLEMAPEKHLKQVLDAGYQIVISEDLLRESYDIYQDGLDIGYETMQGLTVHNEKRVYLKPQLETASITVLHELGHILDKCNGTVSSTPEFKECCTEEKGLIRDYSKNNVSEYFADIYSLSINRMNILTYSREDFPKSIRFIESQPWW